MLDIKLLRDDPDIIRNNIRKRFAEEKLSVLEEGIKLDLSWRESQDRLNTLRHDKNVLDRKVKSLMGKGDEAQEAIAESKELSSRIKALEGEVRGLRATLHSCMLRLPNLAHESVPLGRSEEENLEVKRWGTRPSFPFKVRDHIDLGAGLDLFNLDKAAVVSGARWYYLKNQLVPLQLALIRFAVEILCEKGFTPVYPPAMIREKVMEGAGFLPDGREDIYKIEGEDLFAVGTSEQALAGLQMDEILEAEQLPIKYCGISPCFRTEVGSHGRDTKGIFRVHQFEKVEMFIFSRPEDSWEEHERMLQIAEEILLRLKIPYRVVNVCSGELSSVVSKRYDIEAWLPGQEKYREVVSCSNCTDYQARRLHVRFRDAPGAPTRFVHTLNSTALASTRTLIAVMENYQTTNGEIAVPDALRPHLPFRVIKTP